MGRFFIPSLLSFIAISSVGACVGDNTTTTDASTDSPGQDGTVDASKDSSADVSSEADAAPPPCGMAGEDCCKAPLAPCSDGLTCSTSSPAKCMVSEAWAVGTYSVPLSGQSFPSTVFVTAHYDGSSWTLGKVIKEINFDFNSYYPVDIYENGSEVRVITNESDVGHEYWWNGVSWAECTPGNSCDGPAQANNNWAITSTINNGSNDYWIAGTNVMYRCPSTALCAKVTGVPGNIGQGVFVGETSQDLWYSSVDHVYHFDGTTWTSTAIADAEGMYDVSSKDIWMGYNQLRHWDGTQWNGPFQIDGTQTPGLIWSIGGSATDDVFAVGYDPNNTHASFAAHWDGSLWKKTTLPTGFGLTQKIYVASRIEAFIGGGASPADNKGLIGHWNGTTWSSMTMPTVSYPGETAPGGVVWTSVTGRARPRRAP